MKKINKNNKKKFLKFFTVITSLFIFIFTQIIRKKKFVKKIEKTEEEIVDILDKEYGFVKKETKYFWHKWGYYLKNIFIPHEGNNHRPHIISKRALKIYAVLLISLKIITVGFLFFTYPNPAILSEEIAGKVFNLTNASRAQVGVGQLKWNSALASAAKAKANDMVAKGYFSHIGPDGTQPWQYINKTSYNYVYMGENLAMDFTTAEIVHSAFSKSPTHWKNIVNPKYKDMGIAVVTGKINGRETTILVEFFGSREVSTPTLVATAQAAEVSQKSNSQESEVKPEQKKQPTVKPEEKPKESEAKKDNQKQPTKESEVKPEQKKQPTVKPKEKPKESEAKKDNQKQPTKEDLQKAIASIDYKDDSQNINKPKKLVAKINEPLVFGASEEITAVSIAHSDIKKGMVDYVILISRYLFILFLLALIMILLINIIIKPHMQHIPAVVQTLALILLISSFVFIRFHFIESLPVVFVS